MKPHENASGKTSEVRHTLATPEDYERAKQRLREGVRAYQTGGEKAVRELFHKTFPKTNRSSVKTPPPNPLIHQEE